MSSSKTDESLFAAFRDVRDERALEALLDRHWEASFHLALAIVRDPGAAEDAAQKAFLRVVEAARKGRALDPFVGWLRTVVVNEARMHLRSEKTRARIEEAASARKDAGERSAPDAAAVVREYAEGLPESLREPLVLHFGLGFTHAEVAAALGAPRTTITTRLNEATERLRRALEVGGLGATAAVGLEAVLAGALDARTAPAPKRPDARTLVARARSVAPAAAAASGVKLLLATTLAAVVLGAVALAPLRFADGDRSEHGSAHGAPDVSPIASDTLPPERSARRSEQRRASALPAGIGAAASPSSRTAFAPSGPAGAETLRRLKLEARVVNEDGTPAAGARVAFFAGDLAPGPDAPATATREPRQGCAKRMLAHYAGELEPLGAAVSDARGVVALDLAMVPGTGVLIAAADRAEESAGYGAVPRSAIPATDGVVSAPTPIVLHKVGCVTVSVRLGGKPEPGATVEVDVTDMFGGMGEQGRGTRVAKSTDREGLVVLATTCRDVVVTVRKDGFVTEVQSFHLEGSDARMDVDLALAATISGVARGPDGEPLAGATIFAAESDAETVGRLHYRIISEKVTTDREGRFELGEVKPGSRCLVVANPPAARRDLIWCVRQEVPAPANLVFEFGRAARIVIASECEDGLAAAPADLRFLGEARREGAWRSPLLSRTVEDENGKEKEDVFEGLAPGTYRFVVESKELAPTLSAEVTVKAGDDVKVPMRLVRGRKLAGRVVDASGARVTGEVKLPWRDTSVEIADGAFVFEHFPPGDIVLGVCAEGCDRVEVLVRDGVTEIPDVVVHRRAR